MQNHSFTFIFILAYITFISHIHFIIIIKGANENDDDDDDDDDDESSEEGEEEDIETRQRLDDDFKWAAMIEVIEKLVLSMITIFQVE